MQNIDSMTEFLYGKDFKEMIDRITSQIKELEPPYKKNDENFNIDTMWGWSQIGGQYTFCASAECTDLKLRSKIQEIIKIETEKFFNPK